MLFAVGPQVPSLSLVGDTVATASVFNFGKSFSISCYTVGQMENHKLLSWKSVGATNRISDLSFSARREKIESNALSVLRGGAEFKTKPSQTERLHSHQLECNGNQIGDNALTLKSF
jgi:hypothetical protein